MYFQPPVLLKRGFPSIKCVSGKHAVTFDEAATVFRDSKALSIFDPDHSETEERWITLGISEKGRLLIVIHTFQEKSEDAVTIRIISSRKATKQEIKTYGE
ncbi:MAG: BrnT family toxin [Pseudomonadota bacterium]